MQRPFFSLVRSGLWGTAADASLFQSVTPDDWQELYRMAQSQALLALTFDGISTLPAELRPPRTLYLQWAANTARIEQANARLNRMVTELQSLYTGAGLHPVLLKGQGIAANYRNPLHRQCGDIDIYLGKKENWARSYWRTSSPPATSGSTTPASSRAPRVTGRASGTPSAAPRADATNCGSLRRARRCGTP